MTTKTANTPMSGGSTPSNAVYGSDYMVEVLRALGVKYIALNPGASYRGLHDSIVNFGSGGPEMVLCTHEEIAVAVANGYFRVTGEPIATGLHNVVGLQHASMAIFNAWCDRSAIINLGGGGPQDANQRRSTDWVHTALVQGNAVRDYVKFDDQPASIEAMPESLLRAMRTAMTDPKGPVYVCLDSTIQEQRMDEALPVPDVSLFRPPAPPAPNADALAKAVDVLAGASWPVMVVGEVGRNPSALPAVVELAETLACAVVDAEGRFGFPNTHPLDLTGVRERALADADVVLALDVPSLGVPLGPSVRERGALQLAVPQGTRLIHVTLLDQERQNWVTDNQWLLPVEVPIAADTAQAVPLLAAALRERLANSAAVEERRARVTAMHDDMRATAAKWVSDNWDAAPISAARLYGEIAERVKGVEWAMVNSHGRRVRDVLEITDHAHELGGGRGAGVGYGLPSSVGAALAYRGTGRLCISVVGDGDFLMTSNALWTAAHCGIPLLVVVFNNRSYYNDEEHQERIARWRDRPVENKGIGIQINDPAPDFATLARAFDVAGFGPVSEPSALGPALDEAIAVVRSGKPAVVDVLTQPR
ncbi:MAG: thiamine pyrophosphate-binding protein [Chloroflexi bacterium]|nr:thiamine pyrophosphate-binding protein [Chloroflexota bacterium]MYK35711.1 thiamine pyrophosphate-binding protein [Chloroflexota bacterium]